MRIDVFCHFLPPRYLELRNQRAGASFGTQYAKFLIYTNLGWPFETSKAMARLAFGGVMERFPRLKIVTHHAGGMVPFFHKRIELSWEFNERLMGYTHDGQTLTRRPLDYYRSFYCDIAIQGNTAALMCAHDFFGADHMPVRHRLPVRR